MLRSEVAELHWHTGDARAHHQNRIARLESPLLDADVVHHALIRVVVRVEYEGTERRIKWSARRGNTRDERFKDFGDADPRLRRSQDHLFAWDGEGVFKFTHHRLWVGGGKVDLVQYRNDDQAKLHRQVHIGEGLRFDTLARINHEDGAIARLQAS